MLYTSDPQIQFASLTHMPYRGPKQNLRCSSAVVKVIFFSVNDSGLGFRFTTSIDLQRGMKWQQSKISHLPWASHQLRLHTFMIELREGSGRPKITNICAGSEGYGGREDDGSKAYKDLTVRLGSNAELKSLGMLGRLIRLTRCARKKLKFIEGCF
jgi:hypothetical protein